MATAEIVRDVTYIIDATRTGTDVLSVDQLEKEIAAERRSILRGEILRNATFFPGVILAGPGIGTFFEGIGSFFRGSPHPEQLLIGVGATALGAFLICISKNIENQTNDIRWRARSSSISRGTENL